MSIYIPKTFKEQIGFNDKLCLHGSDRFNPTGVVTVRDYDTGEIIFTKTNKITLAGAGFMARSMFDLSDPEITPSYNNALVLDNTINTTGPGKTNRTYLFCVGIDGCGRENSQVYAEDYKHWIDADHIAPFQYRPITKDLTDSQRKSIYMGRKTLASYYAYYFKKFDTDPILSQQFTDGTPIDSTIYSTTSTLEVQTVVTIQMSVTPDDCRDYFIETTGINDARINSISLCTAWYKTIDNFPVYQDIRPITRLNFPNECLIDLNKGITITYLVYF